ncbi:hypothetical protein D3C72_1943770 [compost metagenome]
MLATDGHEFLRIGFVALMEQRRDAAHITVIEENVQPTLRLQIFHDTLRYPFIELDDVLPNIIISCTYALKRCFMKGITELLNLLNLTLIDGM